MTEDKLTEEEIAAIRAREAAATPGPWAVQENNHIWQLFAYPTENAHGYQLIKAPKKGTQYMEYWPAPEDATFIAHARTDIPRLLTDRVALLTEATHLRHALVELASAVNALALAQRLQPDGDGTALQVRLTAALLAAEDAVGLPNQEGH